MAKQMVGHSYVSIEKQLDLVRDQYAREEGYISNAESTSPWVPWGENVWIRHLTFDVRNNSAANVLWVASGGVLGKHRHRGPVSGYVVEGSWRYMEYDWVANVGDFIRESPGRAHTLVSQKGMKTVFWLNGPLEFLDENDQITEIIDVFWFINHYTSYCKEHGITVNEELFLVY
ncbi:2,4'-dihydroxyacetophenone dioxygenase family protein [Alicyclobacillus dauci]|uniref:2,4'-dihydroxyacetophenone dioxygenase family protein n=1 Tax=Alicyclobacillus dauci TaxID=1475485 RepID=A0ABY6YYA4_9BACL|nr:2,4'-dihydroxyacetophenone dioxygenase family protein [Alicyclobacillus dauci]WAH35595.1 2,4'-dihydroxyacetophenone dioxygenase family protein [Alicyclobacillus dauci]